MTTALKAVPVIFAVLVIGWGAAWWESDQAKADERFAEQFKGVAKSIEKMDQDAICERCRRICAKANPSANCWEICEKAGEC